MSVHHIFHPICQTHKKSGVDVIKEQQALTRMPLRNLLWDHIMCWYVNMMPHCLMSENKHAIKLTMQSNDAVYNIQHRLAKAYPYLYGAKCSFHLTRSTGSIHISISLSPGIQNGVSSLTLLLVIQASRGVVYSWVRGWLLFCLWFRFLGNSVTCVFCPSGSKQHLDPGALGGMAV